MSDIETYNLILAKRAAVAQRAAPSALLEVAAGAGASEVRAAYRKLVSLLHPDRLAGTSLAYLEPEAREVFVALTQAYEAMIRESKHRAWAKAA